MKSIEQIRETFAKPLDRRSFLGVILAAVVVLIGIPRFVALVNGRGARSHNGSAPEVSSGYGGSSYGR